MTPSSAHPGDSPHAVASAWLSRLRSALSVPAPGAGTAFAALLHPSAYLRDQLLFFRDVCTLHDPNAIAAHVAAGLAEGSGAPAAGGFSHIALDERAGLAPEFVQSESGGAAVQLAFTLESASVRGHGIARVCPVDPASTATGNDWRASLVFVMLDAFQGHEERGPEHGVHGAGGVREPWARVRAERRMEIERDPYVVVVGAGQTGIQVAARLQQLGVPTLVLERNARVGDTWRARYDSLTLNTSREHHTLLYTPYPETWPTYTPKDKLADWLEAYARMHDLLVWTGVELTPDSAPTYDESAHRWTLTVVRNGVRVVLHPAHVVLATGTLGAPHTPAVPDAAVFKGTVLHSSAYTHAAPFAGQRVLVVGAANTAADVCADLVGAHARVTMLQRSPTAVAFQNVLRAYWNANFPPGVPHAVADFKLFAVPNALREERAHAWRAAAFADKRDPDVFGDEDARVKAGMRARAFLFGDGPDGLGAAGEINARFAGYLIDQGFSELVLADKIAIKSGTELARYTPTGVELVDGSALAADAVIFCTGYADARAGWAALFGDEVIQRAGPAWGLDGERELRGQYRPTGHHGLWYAGGAFEQARWMSKQLGLLIQARYLGLWED